MFGHRRNHDWPQLARDVAIENARTTRDCGINIFEKYLSLWIALAMGGGILLGNIAPGLVNAIAAAEVASVNLVVAVLIWAMVYPMMVGVDPDHCAMWQNNRVD